MRGRGVCHALQRLPESKEVRGRLDLYATQRIASAKGGGCYVKRSMWQCTSHLAYTARLLAPGLLPRIFQTPLQHQLVQSPRRNLPNRVHHCHPLARHHCCHSRIQAQLRLADPRRSRDLRHLPAPVAPAQELPRGSLSRGQAPIRVFQPLQATSPRVV